MKDPLTSEPTTKFVLLVRYGIPVLLIVAGFACLAVAPESSRNEGFALFFGAGVSVLLLNVLYQGVAGMRVGGRRRITIPPMLGYGKRGAGGVIGPDETLVFVVDLVGVR